MRIRNVSSYIVVSIIVCLSIATIPVYACSPAPGAFDYTLQDRIDEAPIIAVGTVTGGKVRSYSSEWQIVEIAEIEVEHYLKGSGSAIIKVDGFGDGADCRSVVSLDTHGIFFINGDAINGYHADYVAVGDAVYSASEDQINEIVAITGQQDAPQSLTFVQQIRVITSEYAVWVVTLGILALVFMMSPFVLRRLRDPRKRKTKRS